MDEEKAKLGETVVLLSDPKEGSTLRASSVLQKNTKLYGPMNALDVENGSSSWNSEGNTKSETTLTVHFGRPVIPVTLKLQFQAGFSAESCAVYAEGATTMLLNELELSDVHEVQTYELSNKQLPSNSLKLVLDDFCDFYGRVILYRLEVWGHETTERVTAEERCTP